MHLPGRPFIIPVACLVFLAATASPYRVDFQAGNLNLSTAAADAKEGGNGGGNGNGGENGNGGGGAVGNGNGGGNGAGSANGGGNENSRGAGRNGATSQGLPNANVVVRHPDGITEKIQNGRYEMQDASGRTIINRGATRADRSRLGG
jgi:hypothetical protein